LRMRTFLAYFHLLNFVIMIFATAYVLSSLWGQLETWSLALYIYYMILGLSGVAIAFWIAIDGKRLELYSANVRKMEEKLIELEKKIRIIKPLNQEKSERPSS
jgi:predicted membrane protein